MDEEYTPGAIVIMCFACLILAQFIPTILFFEVSTVGKFFYYVINRKMFVFCSLLMSNYVWWNDTFVKSVNKKCTVKAEI